jgi:hypothetical protein
VRFPGVIIFLYILAWCCGSLGLLGLADHCCGWLLPRHPSRAGEGPSGVIHLDDVNDDDAEETTKKQKEFHPAPVKAAEVFFPPNGNEFLFSSVGRQSRGRTNRALMIAGYQVFVCVCVRDCVPFL